MRAISTGHVVAIDFAIVTIISIARCSRHATCQLDGVWITLTRHRPTSEYL